MIDVVFQLLIYFLVTFEASDVMAHLDVFTPSPDSKPPEEKPPTPNLIRIVVFPDGYTINDKQVSVESLDRLLNKLAAIDPTQTVMINATGLSPHFRLVEVLDLCAKSGLRNLSVVSRN
jgi:biopolymer transport protein ExbD